MITSHAATEKGLATDAIQTICIENQKKLLNSLLSGRRRRATILSSKFRIEPKCQP